ncbi:TonB-dependent receptor plug domain-containing protein [Gilliamella sp. wkB108]|uniref:TonB-dependent receptor plug domain-containing protein n=1 Tax=Gilliamella sp. wkB108 TaxID=3120256 RepID=UPI0009BE55A1|nr:TonB-dependent receptor [Gilliamella apicola]
MKKTSIYIMILCVTPAIVFADEDTKVKNIEVMNIWGSTKAMNPDVITQSQMQSRNKNNAATAISTMPGAILDKSGNRNELTIRLRGFDSRQVPIFLDGIPIYVPYDGNLDLGRFMTSELANIEVSKGYVSLLQGPNLMGGAINLSTIVPSKPFEAKIAYSEGFARSADNAYNGSARLSVSNDIGFLQFSGSQYKQRFWGLPTDYDNNKNAGANGRRYNSSSDDKQGMIKIGLTPRELDQYIFTYSKQDNNKDSPPTVGVSKGKYRYWKWPDYNKESFYYNGITQLTDKINLQSRFFHDKFINTLLMYKKNTTLAPDYSHYDDYSNGASLQLGIDMRETDVLSFSAHWKDDVHQAQSKRGGSWLHYKDRTYSVATEYQWSVTPPLEVVAAIGYDWRNSKKTNEKSQDNDQQAFNWEMLVKYQFDNDDLLRFSLSDRSRFPTQKERYTTQKPKDNSLGIVNPDLKPERALTLDLTYDGNLNKQWGYQASLYYNHINDAILAHTVIKNGQPFFQNQNSGIVNFYGIDLSIKGDVTSWMKVGTNYGYIYSNPKKIDHVEGLPKHKLYSWIDFSPTDSMDITIMQDLRYSSYNYSDSNEKVAGFGKTDLRIEYRFNKELSTHIAVNNIFDKSYQFTNGYIEEGRNFWLGFEYNY